MQFSSRLSSSNGRPEDRYYSQEEDRKHQNDIDNLYEELKNVYDWSDSGLKSGPRLRGDQRLRYESDDKIDTNSPTLQPLNGRSFSYQNDDADSRYRSSDASWRSTHSNRCLLFRSLSRPGLIRTENENPLRVILRHRFLTVSPTDLCPFRNVVAHIRCVLIVCMCVCVCVRVRVRVRVLVQ